MELSAKGVELLKRLERCSLTAYHDRGKGVLTIGWGDTNDVREGQVITQAEADERLSRRVDEFERHVTLGLRRTVTQGQFDCFVCMAYNVGGPAFRGSTLLRLFNLGDTHGALMEMPKWIHSGGVVNEDLVHRRFAELLRFFEA